MGHQYSRRLGLRNRQFRLVDWNWSRRHPYICDFVVVTAAVAHFHQSFCGSYDAVCRCLRRHVSFVAHGPAVAVLLADAVSEPDVAVAAVPQSARVGRVCRIDIRDCVAAVLVCGV